jgi:hypothetical protein
VEQQQQLVDLGGQLPAGAVQLQQAAAAAVEDGSFAAASNSSSAQQHGGVVPRMLQASGTVPIRVWVEYQGTSSLPEEGKQRLYDTVNVALGVLQKFFKVGVDACQQPASTQVSVLPGAWRP